jgi:hypothetical protein
MSDEDKERLLFHPETGQWAGYKHPFGFKVGSTQVVGSKLIRQRHRAVRDGIEQFNWYSREWQDHSYVPDCIRPFMDEIQAFSEVHQMS